MKKALLIFACLAAILAISNHWTHTPSVTTFEIRGFEFIPQPDDITCGPTSTLMVLRRFGKHPKFDQIEEQTKTKWFVHDGNPVGMTSPDLIAVAMKHFGVRARLEHLTFDGLRYHVSLKRPVIVLLRSGKTTWHYVVVIGFDPEKIIIADPGSGTRRQINIKSFCSAWNFSTDMEGNSVFDLCPLCNGTGHWLSWNLGPLSQCVLCNGTGRQIDLLGAMIRAADIYPNSAIVPEQSVD